ncbi:MAG: 3-phosphoglycerate dehydrogenase [Ruminococcaceae bacterium]|nr:3-phosphoglycerate dehydrogenase [Oscillospiraceae bacterium]
MKNIYLLNKISPAGTNLFDKSRYAVSSEEHDADAIMVRSAAMHEMTFGKNLKAIARCGAGVNNIPLDRAAEEGIVVFNTPGANANAVKELAIAALMLASRDIIGGIEWAKTLADSPDAAKAVEKGKGQFAGVEIIGKTLGVIGLGAIGGMVANAALALGMKVVGCDPYLSVNAAHHLAEEVEIVATFDEVFAAADYLTVHVPATPETKGFINASAIAKMKDGVRILNLARADLVAAEDIKAALRVKKVVSYVTDFPTAEVIGAEGVIAIPHLGASTEEAEDNCAAMAARELIDYLENGNIVNSVNYPSLSSPRKSANRLCILHKADCDARKQISALTEAEEITTKTRGSYGYTIADLTKAAPASVIATLQNLEGVIRVNVL